MPATNDRLLLIKNGRLLDPASKTDAQHDLLLHGPRIVRVGPDLTSSDAEVFDATGLIIAPGFIDLHCHLREPGQEMSETIETGTRAADSRPFAACRTRNR
jgi:dihydroorotase